MRKWIGWLLLLLLFSCSGNDLPSGVLPKEKMESVIWDMIEADNYYRDYVMRDSLKIDIKQARYNLYEQVFQIHKISRAAFDKSFEYYSAHPKLMKEVFDSLSVKGTRTLQDFYKQPPPTEIDSSRLRKFRPRLDTLKAR